MIRRLPVLLVLFLALAPVLRAGIDVDHMVDVLCMKESPAGWNGRPGPCGELGRPQLTLGVWRQHMGSRPFSQARDPVQARACAVKHVEWIVAQLRRRRLAITPQAVATVWHFGITWAGRRSEWGLEVAHLYFDITRSASDRDDHAHQSGYFPLPGSRAEQRPFANHP